MKKLYKRGFTLVEVMITVAIVGVLTTIAVPVYQDYMIRSQVSEGITLASGAKPLIAEYYAQNGEYPKNGSSVGYTGATGRFISNVEIREDSIVATMGGEANNKISGKKLVLTTTVNNGTEIILASSFIDKLFGINIAFADSSKGWSCYSDIEQKFLPKNCESRTIKDKPVVTQPEGEEDLNLIGGSGQFNFKIEKDKPYIIKDFNVYPFNNNGSVLDLSALVGGDLNKVNFERDGANTLVKIDGLKSILTIENVDLSQNGMLNSDGIKNFLKLRNKLIV